MRRLLIVVLAFILISILQTRDVTTQTSGVCPVLVRDALRQVEQHCAGTGRNQICYGHSVLLAEARPEITDVLLSMPGDVTEIHNISRVQLYPMDVDLEAWGVALMRVQANLPDALPGQNVLFLLFGDVELMPDTSDELVSPESEAAPVSAFRLRSGIGTPLCDSAPPDGLLIQTPHGVGRVELTINGVDVNLGSTVFFTAQENEYLTVSALEGAALVSTEDGESIALAGSEVQIPLDEDLNAIEPPMPPQPYDEEALVGLPLQVLDRPVEIRPPLTEQEIEVIQAVVADGNAQALLPENTPTPTPECPSTLCGTPSSRTPTQIDSGAQGAVLGGETSIPRTNTRTPDSATSTLQATARPSNSPVPTNPPTTRPTNSPVPTTPPTLRPTDPPPPTIPPTLRPTDPPPPTNPPPTDPPPPTNPLPTDPPPPPTNCPGQSCNAPGHGGSCPGNSCNAPGQNKRPAATSFDMKSYKKLLS